jgi:hypothetical protein
MKALPKFLVISAFIVAGGYAACSLIYPTFYVRYRLSLDVDADGNVQTSSGVVEADYSILSNFRFGEGPKFGSDFHGNAITIDLGKRGLVFVVNMPSQTRHRVYRRESQILGSSSLASLPLDLYGSSPSQYPSGMADQFRNILRQTGSNDVPIDVLPMFVRFRDINDEKSIEEVDPGDLAATLGPGVKLVRARFELTRDPITPVPADWPNWLIEHKDDAASRTYYGGSDPHKIFFNLQEFKGD